MTELTAAAGPASTLLDRLGGRRGLVEGAVPPIVFAATNAIAGLVGFGPQALMLAISAAVLSAVVITAVGVAQGTSLAGALRGAAFLAVAVGFVLWTGSARDFFLPGIVVDATYAVLVTLSVIIGRPAVGYAYAFLVGLDRGWRRQRRLRRAFSLATLIWSVTYGVRAVAQSWLYREDLPEMLALAKLLLGWPLTALAVLGTVALVRRTDPARSRLS